MLTLLLAVTCSTLAADHPLSAEQRSEMHAEFDAAIAEATKLIEQDPQNVSAFSRRGDAHFFAGQFDKAVADYEAMVELDPDLDRAHWRRGIAYFYAGQYDKAARQFEVYHSFDNVDRENGIWRFFSQAKAHGFDKAKDGLLNYEKDDRRPFPSVYQLFAGETTPEAILKEIRDAKIDAKIDAAEREKRLFYAELYIGLNHAVHDRREDAQRHLREAVKNTWGRRAGYGPRYMWHVGRLHYEKLTAEKQQK
ncbi:MAG: tetratricopeptide repeat protein [Planctomycetaceae bacterium]